MRFRDKICIVTGGGLGIGEAVVKAFAREGANVAILDVDIEKATAVAHEAQLSTGRKMLAVLADVSRKRAVEEAVAKVVDTFGRADILVNNAGIWRGALLTEMSEDDWDAVFAVNVKGVFLCCQTVAKVMMQQGAGTIVNIASVAGKGRGSETWGTYCASKAAVIMLTRVLASELKSYGIEVNALCPGATETHLLRTIIAAQGGDYSHAAKPEDVAEAVLLLASNEAKGVTGEDFDGPPWANAESLRKRIQEVRRTV